LAAGEQMTVCFNLARDAYKPYEAPVAKATAAFKAAAT
jgi:hypothetical protein